MSATSAALVRQFKVGPYSITLSVPKVAPGGAASACVEWEPHMPKRLSVMELAQYRAGRDAAIAEIANELGGTVAVMEV
jgi:hypothetical protein